MKILVTGGGGFLGGAIVDRCLARGDQVASFSRRAYPELTAKGVTCYQGDLADLAAVSAAVKGCDAVFHVAALPGIWGDYETYYQTNTVGTQNVITACQTHQCPRLIYTSTPSVIHSGGDVEGIDESHPYPDSFLTHYPATKALAEQAILAANSPTLSTVALRPHLIWGPNDNQLVPRLVERSRSGRLRLIGKRSIKVDSIYIDNAAEAHLNALERLAPDTDCAGRAYFITNGEPMEQAALINALLAATGEPPVKKRIPAWLAYGLGWVFETTFKLFRIQREPPMTRFLARQLSTAHWYDISAARRDLGYEPRVMIEEGLERLEAWWKTR